MFENLTKNFTDLFEKIRKRGKFTKHLSKDSLKRVRDLLIDSDVSVLVAKKIVQKIEKEISKRKIYESFNPDKNFVKIVQKVLVQIIGEKFDPIRLSKNEDLVILMVGSKGSGKTTTTAKLGRVLRETYNKKVLLASTDVLRPAAFEQLKKLSSSSDLDFFDFDRSKNSADLAKLAISHFKSGDYDALIVDTMGCMHTDLKKMMEIKKIHGIVHPSETFFVVDSMIGQDIINSSKVFDEMFSLTGIVLTKMDGDSRGGCALSIKEITGKPIAFLGTGENVKSMEGFHPHKIVSRILGKEDISSLMDDIKKEFSINFQKNIFQKSQKNVYKFNLNDLLEQLNYISSADNIKRILERIPHVGYGLNKFTKDMDETFFKKMRAIIQSMTYEERSNPEIIKGSRKKRISFGSGTKIQEVNFLLKKFQEIKRIEKSLRKRKFLSS